MPVLPTFQPENDSAGQSAGLLFSGMNESQSLMDRSQARRIQDEQNQRAQAEFVAKMPLITAQATLMGVQAKSAVDAAVLNTRLETRAAAESPTAVKEFNDAMTYNAANEEGFQGGAPELDENGNEIPQDAKAQEIAAKFATQATYETRVQKLSALAAKYSYMKNLKDPGYAGFYNSVTTALVQANEAAHANMRINELMEVANTRALTQRYVADTGNATKETVAGTRAGATVEAATIGAQSREKAAVTSAEGRRDAAKIRADHQYQLDHYIELRDAALKQHPPDKELAQLYQDGINKINTSSMSTAENVRPLPNVAPAVPEAQPGAAPAQPESAAPAPAPVEAAPGAPVIAQPSAAAPAAAPKLYVVDPASKRAELAPTVKTPQQTLAAYQQMIDDGVIDAKTARAELTQLGFKPKR